ncbi:MAG: 50S ribosomal protein L15 [Chloroflexi bacterium]|nr:50S ribosomal protein L15 [Chloroflexota bacterium]
MKLSDLKPDKGATRRSKRVGRGISAGQGKTAGRGTKGQGARRGGGKGPYFEGGQLPLVRRLPFKRGFTNIFRIEYQEVNVEDLQARFQDGDEVTPESLAAQRLIREADEPVVVLGRGDLDIKLTVKAHRFSKSAAEKIEKAGGSTEKLELLLTGAHATVKKLPKAQLEVLRAARSQDDS